jgi:hypothetical protein
MLQLAGIGVTFVPCLKGGLEEIPNGRNQIPVWRFISSAAKQIRTRVEYN